MRSFNAWNSSDNSSSLNLELDTYMYTAILRKVVGKSARGNPVWVILSALFFKEI